MNQSRLVTFPHPRPLALVCLALAFAPVALAGPAEDRGLEIARKADKANDGWKGERSRMEMLLVNAHGDKTTRKLVSRVVEIAGDGDRSRIEFEWPADVKGTRMLTWTHKQNEDDQWLFLPAVNRVKRIASNNKSGSFMGSEFSYEDLSSQEIEKYRHKFLADDKLEGRTTWKLERIPVDPRSGYSKQVVWMDTEYLNPLKIEYYDRKGELLKTALFSGYSKQSKWWRVGKIVMTNHQTKKASHLSFTDRELGASLAEDDFRSDRLEQR